MPQQGHITGAKKNGRASATVQKELTSQQAGDQNEAGEK